MNGNKQTITLAFLQNLWVKDPERVRRMMYGQTFEYRRQLLRRLLFAGGMTGRRIKNAFRNLLPYIEFEEVSLEIAGDSKTIGASNPEHIRAALYFYSPSVVITFGKIARDAVSPLWRGDTITAPHPAARQMDTQTKLELAAETLLNIIDRKSSEPDFVDKFLRANGYEPDIVGLEFAELVKQKLNAARVGY